MLNQFDLNIYRNKITIRHEIWHFDTAAEPNWLIDKSNLVQNWPWITKILRSKLGRNSRFYNVNPGTIFKADVFIWLWLFSLMRSPPLIWREVSNQLVERPQISRGCCFLNWTLNYNELWGQKSLLKNPRYVTCVWMWCSVSNSFESGSASI